MKLDIKALTIASAVAGVLVYILGALMDRLSAWGGAALVSYILRVDVVQLSHPLTLDSFVAGVASFGALFALIGFTVAKGYNLLSARAHPATNATRSAPPAGRPS